MIRKNVVNGHFALLAFTIGSTLSITFLDGCAWKRPGEQGVKRQAAKLPLMPVSQWKPNVRHVYKSAVFALQFSPDGKTLASAGGTAKTSPYPGEGNPGVFLRVQMLNAQTLRPARTLPLLPDAYLVAFSPDLKRIVTNPRTWGGLQLIDAATGKILWKEKSRPDPPDPLGEPAASFGVPVMLGASFSPNGKYVVTRFEGRTLASTWVRFWSVQGLKLKEGPDIFLGDQMVSTTSAAFSPDGQRVIMGSADGALALCDAKTSKVIWWQRKLYEEFSYPRRIENLVFSPDGKIIASTHQDHSVRLWSAQNGQLLHALKRNPQSISSLVFSPDSTMIASSSQNGTIVVSSTRSGKTLQALNAKHGAVTTFAFSPDSSHLAAGYWDGTVMLWRAR